MALPNSLSNNFGPIAAEPTSRVELTLTGRQLADLDLMSKSDPMCVAYVKSFGTDKWVEVKRTEVIHNNLNPEWSEKIQLDYLFEERQHLRFEVYDVDTKHGNILAKQDFIGFVELTLGEIVSLRSVEKALLNRNKTGKSRGFLRITAEELSICKELLTLGFEASNVAKMDFFGKSDPFLTIHKRTDVGLTLVHRTEVVKNTLKPKWKPFEIAANSLSGGSDATELIVRCADWNRSGEEKFIGEFTTTLAQLKLGPNPNNIYPLINEKKRGKKGYQNSGLCSLYFFKVDHIHTFMDYISSGTQLNCTIAIDFTASNGDPRQPNSLHYLDPTGRPSLYARAIQAVGEVIQDYDSDKLFPLLGFGAKVPPTGQPSHLFFANHKANPYCNGLTEVLTTYRRCVETVQFYGPTHFAPIVNHVASIASQSRNGSEYFILLMLTDGIIDDMFATKEAIVNASLLPLSIIIVGVGGADFSLMEELDGDRVRLSANGRLADRDIVQFVPFRDFISVGVDLEVSQLRLAKEVIAEIPQQFMSYMRKNNCQPGSFNPT